MRHKQALGEILPSRAFIQTSKSTGHADALRVAKPETNQKNEEAGMTKWLYAALGAVMLGLAGQSGAMAAPIVQPAASQAASSSALQEVRWVLHCHWRHHHHHHHARRVCHRVWVR